MNLWQNLNLIMNEKTLTIRFRLMVMPDFDYFTRFIRVENKKPSKSELLPGSF